MVRVRISAHNAEYEVVSKCECCPYKDGVNINGLNYIKFCDAVWNPTEESHEHFVDCHAGDYIIPEIGIAPFCPFREKEKDKPSEGGLFVGKWNNVKKGELPKKEGTYFTIVDNVVRPIDFDGEKFEGFNDKIQYWGDFPLPKGEEK